MCIRDRVNAIIHPAVKKYLADRLAEAKNKGDVELFFVEAALLIESGYEHIVDEMWYIYAREDVRRRRLSESRNYTPEKIEKIIASQLSEEEFRQHCDFVIDNSDSLEDSYRPVSYTHLGHLAPMMPIVTGSCAEVQVQGNDVTLRYDYR